MTDDIFVWNDALPINLFEGALDEFNPMYNFRYEMKSEVENIPESLIDFYPTWACIEKPRPGQGLGDSLQLIRISTYAKLWAQKILRRNLELVRINTNIQKFGDETTFHDDGPEGWWTFLVYVMPHWNMEWGGDFVIRNSQNIYQSVPCFPNRAILFKAHLEHRGGAPNRLCMIPRLSLAFTYKEI